MFGQDNNIKKKFKKKKKQAPKMKLQRKGLYIKSPFVCNFILGTYFFANNKTKPPYVVAKSDNKQYIAARCRRHGSDLHASCGESSDLVFRLKQQLNLPWRWTYHMFGQDNNSKKKKCRRTKWSCKEKGCW